jgi:hypothetical protein
MHSYFTGRSDGERGGTDRRSGEIVMWATKRAVSYRIGVVLVAGTALLAGCGGKEVTFQPVDGPGASETTSPPSSSPSVTGQAAQSTGVSTDASTGVVISRNGTTICVRGRNGGQACTGLNGTIVVDGVTVSKGVVVSGDPGSVSTVTPRPTSGQIRISGAVNWSGRATGTCDGHGTGVRRVVAELPGLGRLAVQSVGDGVLKMSLDAKGDAYALSYVGSGGPVRATDGSLVIDSARMGRGGRTVTVSGSFDC